ncbi:hypothetical protein J2W91_002838 [Paenibacillus amylolyticus]|uniref:Uncharacterized protein n=1 Tax=Paenibacillus amylolyticus TaxID=1451 RepID=A0AAP5LP63_PAEAM|nr:hypothetical protein [Paenibacillus amylolyticus]
MNAAEVTENKRWSINKSVIIPLVISILLPLLSILLPVYTSADGFTYKLGFPINFFYFYGESLPKGLNLFSWEILSKHVSFRTLLYTFNVMLCYTLIYLIKMGINKIKGK